MSKKNGIKGHEISAEEQQAKIRELRQTLGMLTGKLQLFGTDDCVCRYLRARNWNVKKASKMLKDTIKWRLEYRPETIQWDDVAKEAETGKIYRANYIDNHGRTVLVMRPGFQNTTSTKGQIKYLVYCMENAILNLPPGQEQMVWLIDFKGWGPASISVKVTRETAHVLQNHYPERLGLAILYNPPRIFESFWTVVKPFLEPKTYRKVKFVYSDDPSSKVLTELVDPDKLESAFGGRNPFDFNFVEYGERMKEEDKKMETYWASTSSVNSNERNLISDSLKIDSTSSEEEEETRKSVDNECASTDHSDICTATDTLEKMHISS